MSADTYHGAQAANYDATREGTPTRKAEREAVLQLVRAGPVLDCPVGTGAFSGDLHDRGFRVVGDDISPAMTEYARRKHPWLHVEHNDVLAGLPYADAAFATVVSMRFLWLLKDGDMQRALTELRRVAEVAVVFSIRLGATYGKTPGRNALVHTREQLAQGLGAWRVDKQIQIGRDYYVLRAVP